MNETSSAFNAAMGKYQLEVVRWNRQINLVSRQDTQGRVAGLISQCRATWSMLVEAELAGWSEGGPVWYFDLGSGGGVPGFVWHQLLAMRFTHSNTWLVEPREKRAWFLERLNQITPERPLRVWNARWGETPGGDGEPPLNILISLKALRMSDPKVIGGLARAVTGSCLSRDGRVVIARFYPPQQRWTKDLATELEFSSEPIVAGGYKYQPLGQQVLSPKHTQPTAAALVISTYQISD